MVNGLFQSEFLLRIFVISVFFKHFKGHSHSCSDVLTTQVSVCSSERLVLKVCLKDAPLQDPPPTQLNNAHTLFSAQRMVFFQHFRGPEVVASFKQTFSTSLSLEHTLTYVPTSMDSGFKAVSFD